MTKQKTSKVKQFTKATMYNAMCGVLGNVITDVGQEMPALNQ